MRPQGMNSGRGRGGSDRGRGGRGGMRGRGRGGMGIEKFAFGKTSTYQKHDANSEARKHKRAVVTKYKRMLKAEGGKVDDSANSRVDGVIERIGDEEITTEVRRWDSEGGDSDGGNDDSVTVSEPSIKAVHDKTRKNKSDPYAKQKAIAEANKAAREAAQRRKDEEIKMAEKKKDQSVRTRKNRTKKLQARTPKGQPVLRNQMKDILKTLNREKYSAKSK
ncbi:hypothetical protein SARC_05407 [Sphaeroforma arctica JP610]|uniref:rRNA-processing protein FYV7 n=1 Tax=Sphaeroforma arctica JP610 TaxID=667725 RepID=A0A0L0FZR4_9EUKA|nr:hypothetical protein SARC_05407 [Sphaeroforma arctica JP610]KNC82315.1 hypothetical protein SARC_05407 [Sphaeroforma arctica JP610]|eukprot:XP_014156217.1 hypothetical protein SARC_05407 [Sphaeroforma arctica JP610]